MLRADSERVTRGAQQHRFTALLLTGGVMCSAYASRDLLADPRLYRAKNDAGICYKAEGFFGGPDRKECQKVGQYTFYYTWQVSPPSLSSK